MGIKRAVGRAMIKVLVGGGLDMGDVLREVRRAGYSYRHQDMLDDVRQFSGRMKYESRIISYDPNEYVPKGFMVQTDLKEGKKYRVHGWMEQENLETGEITRKPASFYTDYYQRKGDWERDFMSFNWQEVYGEQWRTNSFTIRAVEHNEKWPY